MRMTVEAARKKFAETIDGVRMTDKHVVLTRYGKPVAAIVGMDDLERLELLRADEDSADARAAKRIARRRTPEYVAWDEVNNAVKKGEALAVQGANRARGSKGVRQAARRRAKRAASQDR